MRLGNSVLFLALLAGCAATVKLPQEEIRARGELWALYKKEDPQWASHRDRALQEPQRRDFLIQNLIREMIHAADQSTAQDPKSDPQVLRAKKEIAFIGAPAVTWLMVLLEQNDPAVADYCSEALAYMGQAALPALREGLESENSKTRRWSLKTLARMQPPQERMRVARMLVEDEDWKVRATAAEEILAYQASSADGAVREELQKGLQDEDAFVQRKSAESLAALGDVEAVPALIRFLNHSRRKLRPQEAEAAVAAMRKLSGQSFGNDPGRWQQWWETLGK